MTYRSSKSVHRCDLCAWRRDKKRKKDKDRNPTVANWLFARPPTSSHRNEILRGGWSSDDSSKFRISSKSVKRFRSCGGSKFAHPHWLGLWVIQQLVLPYKPWSDLWFVLRFVDLLGAVYVADINECSTLNGGCSQTCTNTVGSFRCSCLTGYTLASDSRQCSGQCVCVCPWPRQRSVIDLVAGMFPARTAYSRTSWCSRVLLGWLHPRSCPGFQFLLFTVLSILGLSF